MTNEEVNKELSKVVDKFSDEILDVLKKAEGHLKDCERIKENAELELKNMKEQKLLGELAINKKLNEFQSKIENYEKMAKEVSKELDKQTKVTNELGTQRSEIKSTLDDAKTERELASKEHEKIKKLTRE